MSTLGESAAPAGWPSSDGTLTSCGCCDRRVRTTRRAQTWPPSDHAAIAVPSADVAIDASDAVRPRSMSSGSESSVQVDPPSRATRTSPPTWNVT
jgi:hypothetical protein